MARLYDSHTGIANGKRDACEPLIRKSKARHQLTVSIISSTSKKNSSLQLK